MSYEPSESELLAVIALPGQARYEYTIKRIVDFEELWSIGGDTGWALMSVDSTGREAVPVWPARAFAELCCKDAWNAYEARRIGLLQWIEKWIPGMIAHGRQLAVFPLPDDRGSVIDPSRMNADLQGELEKYE